MDGDTPRAVTTVALPAIPAGTTLAAFEVDVPAADIGADGFLAVVDDDGTGGPTLWECHEDDNTARWEAGCP